MTRPSVVVVGAGPGGLTAAHELAGRGMAPLVLEKASQVGGLARTETHGGYHFDVGGHRFYTKVPEIQRFWDDMLGPELRRVRRRSRIYYGGRFFDYPLSLPNTLANLGAVESTLSVLSYVRTRARPRREHHTFEQWVSHRFGQRLYERFFRTYTEKVWGIPCDRIAADWAAQRIKGLSLTAAVANAVFRRGDHTSLINEFRYPRLGPGMMWQRCGEEVERRGGRIWLDTDVALLRRRGARITEVVARRNEGDWRLPADQVISSMPIAELVQRLDPPPPAAVLAAAGQLTYRAFVLVGLVLDTEALFPDQWLYVHAPEVRVGRIQNYGNWSDAMVPHAGGTALGMEYFCNEGDDVWSMSDAELVALATRELSTLGLTGAARIRHGIAIRQPKAYPVYDGRYREHLSVLQAFLASMENLQTIGRNGMHRYNNQDHSMLTGLLAARNLLGERHDLWSVNTERSYYEEMTAPAANGTP